MLDDSPLAGRQGQPVTGRDRPGDLTFPDVPRLRLEELLYQLTERAQDVLAAQGRLRALIRANAAVAGELSLPLVLRRTAEAAVDLADARYGALGVLGTDGLLEQFVHVGMDPATAARIGSLPQGLGVLGVVSTDPSPVRVPEVGAHPAAVGFPPGHPPMHSFLGVPIRIRDRVFGNLYLGDSTRGEFSDEDEQVVCAFASTAAVAIENAMLYDESERRQQWLAASTDLTQQLFAAGSEATLELVLHHAARGADADLAALALPAGEDTLQVQAAVGALADRFSGLRLPIASTIAGQVMQSGKPVLVNDYSSEAEDADLSQLGPVIVVPLLSGDRVLGTLSAARLRERRPFSESDRDQLALFANHAGVALELARARADQEALRQMEYRDAVAADLHEHVIGELFAVGMGLQGMLTALDRPELRARVTGYVDALDATIERIRSTLFHGAAEAGHADGSEDAAEG
jgi:GAF domain-containing protein